jgi:hypothetical protein
MKFSTVIVNLSKIMHVNQKECTRPVYKIHTTHAKTNATANAGAPVPSCRPIAVARAVTVAEWDEGIPPDPSILLASHLFSLNLPTKMISGGG